jgi:ATP-binding cassette subfamily F protein 3
MITVNDIAVEFGGTTLFSEVTFAINETDKIALMGKNGAGKSTLLKIVAGENKPTRGIISAPKEAVIAYLPQHLLTSDNCTVMEEASKAFAEASSPRRYDMSKSLFDGLNYSNSNLGTSTTTPTAVSDLNIINTTITAG